MKLRAMTDADHLPKSAFGFLDELAQNNSKTWFDANRERCEEELVEPCRGLVRGLTAALKKPFPHIIGSDAKVGGSLTRLHRDTRFAKDKTPYHTSLGLAFWHSAGQKMEVPGFFLKVDTEGVLLATGLHQPDKEPLQRVREAIDNDSKAWRKATGDAAFVKLWGGLEGESLKRVPAPWDAEHPCADDLRRKDFTAFARVAAAKAARRGFAADVVERWTASRPLMRFLCKALELPA